MHDIIRVIWLGDQLGDWGSNFHADGDTFGGVGIVWHTNFLVDAQ